MTIDHINKFLYHGALPGFFEAGRIAFPLFGFVLAYNLARPGALERGGYRRTLQRLAIFALVATPFYLLLWGIWPLNVLYALLLAAALMYLSEGEGWVRQVLAVVLFSLGGFFVEFWWFGLFYCVAAWRWCKTGAAADYFLWIVATTGLYLANTNLWALAAVPLVLLASRVDLGMPRIRWAFYIYYPLHLGVLLLVSRLGLAGHL